jgi:hypothetical protein
MRYCRRSNIRRKLRADLMKLAHAILGLAAILSLGNLCAQAVSTNSLSKDFHDAPPENLRIADVLDKIPVSQTRVYLYSLDPTATFEVQEKENQSPAGSIKKSHADMFDEWIILGFAEIHSSRQKTNLLAALSQTLRHANNAWSNCIFEPRHAVRLVNQSGTNDFLICFRCELGESKGYIAGNVELTISGESQPEFERLRVKYGLRKAK